MAALLLEKPGFGWATPKNATANVVLKNGKVFEPEDLQNNYPGVFLSEFAQANDIAFTETPEAFTARLKMAMESLFTMHGKIDELEELQSTGKSNGRSLKWDIMTIQPNCAFRLHAHPNIELIHVIAGSLHEFRFQGPPMKDYSLSTTDNEGPDFSQGITAVFEQRTVSASISTDDITSGFLVNEKGSVHQSFTAEFGCHLFLLWSGCHANVSKEHQPPPGVIPSLPAGVISMHHDP